MTPELWPALLIGALGTGATAALLRRTSSVAGWLDTGLLLAGSVIAGLVIQGKVPFSAVVAVVTGVAAARFTAITRLPSGAAAISIACAAAVYACVPDTEHALTVLGATIGVGVVAELTRLPWGPGGVVVTSALGWVALIDGDPRPGAVVGALAIAAVHGIAIVALRSRPPLAWSLPFAVLVVGAAAWCSRVAGLERQAADALVLAIPAVVAVVGAAILLVAKAPASMSAAR